MKRINKISIIALLAVMFIGVDAFGLGINKVVPLDLQAEANKGTWDANSKKLGWTQINSNLYFLTALSNQNLTGYDKITVNVSNANNQTYRLLITINGANYTASMSGNGNKELSLKNSFKQGTNGSGTTVDLTNRLNNVSSVRIGGNSNRGTITLNSITLHKTVNWNSNNQITFTAFDFNRGDNVTATNNNTFSFTGQYQSIYLSFDQNLNATEIAEEPTQNFTVSGTSTYTCFENGSKVEYGFDAAKNAKMAMNLYRICVNGRGTVTMNSVVFTKKVTTAPVPSTPSSSFSVTDGRIFFEDFENLDNNSARNGNKGIESLTDASLMALYENRPENNSEDGRDHRNWQGKYLNYGGRGKVMQDPAFGKYYQNLADADVHTKSIAENYLRMIFTDDQKNYMRTEINKAGTGNRAATIGFWVNGKVAVENELPLERGSMFSIFSNYRFRKADNFDEKPRFMFDLACNGWTYSYMPNNDGAQKDNYFFYGEKSTTNTASNPLASLFGKQNYANTLDQSQHKFYDDKKWHYVSYVLDKDFTRVIIYLDGEETGRIENLKTLDKNKFEVKFENGGDYVGRFFYLRNLVLGGFTPHGLFYDKQYYSDAALAYDDVAIYSKALTPAQIKAIIEQKGYTPQEWQFGNDNENASHGTSFNEKTTGLGSQISSEDADGYIVMNKYTELTIPNVPAGHYVRIEYKYVNDNDQKMPTSTDNSLFSYVGLRDSENDANFQTITFHANATKTYHYFLTINSPIAIRSIIITPYQYADLKWASEKVDFNVVGTTYKQGNTTVTPSEKYPALLLNIDGKRASDGSMFWENVTTGYKQGKNNPYIKYSSSAPHVATVNTQGAISLNAIAGNTNIKAEVISNNLFEGSNTTASFEIVIKKEENTLRLVADKHDINVNDKYPEKYKEDNMMSDTEKLKNVTFTVGGWPYGNNEYTINGTTVKDDWSKSTNTGVIKGENIDDFTHYTKGAQNALSESIGYMFNDGDRGEVKGDGLFHPEAEFQDNLTPWTLPCRGSFIKVEPVKAGIATVYIFQEGNLSKTSASNKYSSHVAWKPVYIADETGNLVDFVQTATNGKITPNDNFFVGDKRRAQFIEDIATTYNVNLKNDLLKLRDEDHDKFKQLINNWENAGWKQNVIPTVGKGDDACGFMVMSSAIVRYTFNVLPGKTYYLFSNDSQIALSGFNFEEGRVLRAHESDYASNPLREVKTVSVTLSDATNYTVNANSIKDEVEVSYSGRTFTKGQWSSICLPFSMNNRQMTEQFGEGTKVVMLKKIEDGFITFVYHVNQDIIAGYPYLILPGKTTNSIKFNAYNDGKVSSPIFSITETGKTLFDTPNTTLNQYVFEGTLQKTAVNQYGYAMSSTGSLTRLTTADASKRTVKPYRAFINYYGSEEVAKSKQLGVKWETFDEESASETTAIEEMLFEQGILTKNADVYSVNGQKVRTNADCLNGLSKGVYLINGKKVVK